jgi:hypothetical protein
MVKTLWLTCGALLAIGALAFGGVWLRVLSNRASARWVHRDVKIALSALPLIDAAGAARSLTLPEGGVILLVSSTCVHCQALLSRLAAISDGQPVPRLVVLAVDAVKPVKDELVRLKLAVPAYGLANRRSLRSVFGLRGVPGLVWVSGSGLVRQTVLGEVSAEEARTWCLRAGLRDRIAPAAVCEDSK